MKNKDQVRPAIFDPENYPEDAAVMRGTPDPLRGIDLKFYAGKEPLEIWHLVLQNFWEMIRLDPVKEGLLTEKEIAEAYTAGTRPNEVFSLALQRKAALNKQRWASENAPREEVAK